MYRKSNTTPIQACLQDLSFEVSAVKVLMSEWQQQGTYPAHVRTGEKTIHCCWRNRELHPQTVLIPILPSAGDISSGSLWSYRFSVPTFPHPSQTQNFRSENSWSRILGWGTDSQVRRAYLSHPWPSLPQALNPKSIFKEYAQLGKVFLKSVITIIKCLQWETVKRVRKYLELEFNATKAGNILQY